MWKENGNVGLFIYYFNNFKENLSNNLGNFNRWLVSGEFEIYLVHKNSIIIQSTLV